MKKPVRSHKKKEPEGPERGTIAWADKQLSERYTRTRFDRENLKETKHAFIFYSGKMEGIHEVRGIISTIRIPRVKKFGPRPGKDRTKKG